MTLNVSPVLVRMIKCQLTLSIYTLSVRHCSKGFTLAATLIRPSLINHLQFTDKETGAQEMLSQLAKVTQLVRVICLTTSLYHQHTKRSKHSLLGQLIIMSHIAKFLTYIAFLQGISWVTSFISYCEVGSCLMHR